MFSPHTHVTALHSTQTHVRSVGVCACVRVMTAPSLYVETGICTIMYKNPSLRCKQKIRWPASELVTMRMRLSSVVVKYVSDVLQCAGHYDPTATRVAVGV